jgi:hypothetical protein
VSTCSSCGAQIIWGETVGGKRIPLDPVPVVDTPGLFQFVENPEGDPREDLVLSVKRRLFQSHFASCPHAAEHRR